MRKEISYLSRPTDRPTDRLGAEGPFDSTRRSLRLTFWEKSTHNDGSGGGGGGGRGTGRTLSRRTQWTHAGCAATGGKQEG